MFNGKKSPGQNYSLFLELPLCLHIQKAYFYEEVQHEINKGLSQQSSTLL